MVQCRPMTTHRPLAAEELGEAPTDALRGGRLALAHITLAIVVGVTLALTAVGIPAELAMYQSPCDTCGGPALSAEGVRQLAALGLSPGFYAAYFTGIEVAFALVCAATAGL